MRLVFSIGAIVVSLMVTRRALAESEVPAAYDVWFDADQRRPHPENSKLDNLIDGDSLTIHVDPTRLFPPSDVEDLQTPFDVAEAPPQVKGLYVVGPGAGSKTPLLLQPGRCGLVSAQEAQKAASDALEKAEKEKLAIDASNATAERKTAAAKAVDDAKQALVLAEKVAARVVMPRSENSVRCTRNRDWLLDDDRPGYICGGNRTIASLVETSAEWSLVQRDHKTDELVCASEYKLGTGSPVVGVHAEVVNGSSPPEKVVFAGAAGGWSTTIRVHRNVRELRLVVTFEDGTEETRSIALKARARDAHSLVRVQAEILATNRLRAVSMAIAVSPVRRKFFTDGPGWGCIWLCTVTPIALLRLSGDDKTVVQFGVGAGVYFARAFQLNAGLLFGTGDLNSAWRVERAWFAGVAIDPFVLAEVLSTGKGND